ncbi:MAG TPA: flagellar biosynthesis protein FliA, partial [Acetomicrobium hydrogeniformans]|nr:flagellar biosynthesis protein FliA [Acetomicrobium hydrogeniformans]
MDGYEPIYPESDITFEEKLWQRIKFGDEKAREEVIISYRPMVFWLAKKFHIPSD